MGPILENLQAAYEAWAAAELAAQAAHEDVILMVSGPDLPEEDLDLGWDD